jgi:AcrR family transcriptional regulator
MKIRSPLKQPKKPAPRRYRQTVRADAAKARETDILDAFQSVVSTHWVSEFTLADVARAAGVTQQTVIRKFGGKEGLFRALAHKLKAEIRARRDVPPGETARAVAVLVEDYDAVGDLVMRLLEQETRDPALTPLLEIGRREHREWIAHVFAPSLQSRGEAARKLTLDALVAATDLYVWKLLRRDFNYPPSHVAAVMELLVTGAANGTASTRKTGR